MGKKKSTREVMELFHGGRAGLKPGDILIPGAEQPAMETHAAPEAWLREYAPEWVYVTSDQDLAMDYAARSAHLEDQPAGAVYAVKILGPRHRDPDYGVGVSFRCQRARVVRVVDDQVQASGVSLTGAALRHQTWDDGSPLYDQAGFPLPNLLAQEVGVTAADLADLGYGAEVADIQGRIRAVADRLHPVLRHLNQEGAMAYLDRIRAENAARGSGV